MLLLACCLVLGRYGENTVGVDVEGNLDLRDSARCRGNAVEMEYADLLVVLCHRTLTLKHADFYRRLVVLGCGEYLILVDRDGGVGLDELGHHAAKGLDTERKRGNVEQKHVLHVACEHTALNGCTDGNNLVRVHALVRLLAEEILHELLHLRDTGRTAHEDDLVDLGCAEFGIGQSLAARLYAAAEEIVAKSFELGAGKGLYKVLWHAVNCCDIRQVDFCRSLVGELDFGLFCGFLEALQSHCVLLEVHSGVLRCEFGCEPVDDGLVEIVASEVCVTVGGLDFEHSVAEFEDGNIESTAAEVVNSHLHILVLLVETICKSCCSRLVDDSLNIKTRNLAGLLGGLALRVREIGWDCDDSLCNLLTEIVFRCLLHLLEDDGGNLLWRIELAVDVDARSIVLTAAYCIWNTGYLLAHLVVGLAHKALDGEDGVLRICDSLTLGGVTHLALTAVGECHY